MARLCEGNVCGVDGNFTLIIIYPEGAAVCQLLVAGCEVISKTFLDVQTGCDRPGRW